MMWLKVQILTRFYLQYAAWVLEIRESHTNIPFQTFIQFQFLPKNTF